MAATLRVVIAQLNLLVGDIEGNARKIADAARQASDNHQADVVVFPELSLCGYPPEDLLLRPSLDLRINKGLDILFQVSGIDMVVGVPVRNNEELENQAVVIRDGAIIAEYAKWHLPNYRVFDEKRYFKPGSEAVTYDCNGVFAGLTVCEDIWFEDPAAALKESGAQLIFNLNASPFHCDKLDERHAVLRERCSETGLPIVYVNQVGGQDELVFDGGSFVMNGDGEVVVSAPTHEECLVLAEFDRESGQFLKGETAPLKEVEARVYDSLVMGVRDYVNKNGFKGVVLGLSGGIDSALTLAVAADALGPDRVEAIMMPFQYTAEISKEDAAAEAKTLGVSYKELPIKDMYDAFMGTLSEEFAGTSRDTTEENLQSRCRGVMLMAISNKKGYLVLTTGNKSEMAVGYATLYGDMAGGFDVLKDVPKTLVFRLSEYRNTVSPVIPQRVIDRPPSAELAPDQVDEDSLPPYDILDAILELYIEQDQSAEAIIAKGFDRDEVYRILRLVDINEYKRRQAPVGVRITSRGFGKDRRYPITNGWRPGV
ncbi:NAD+ synthase [Sansalvadorimonas sp. 2012CJ34-2]|uniref:Glutamine-dependent NAD(+) synthetase n=1 Tax=Parendozoicomonas callyspongiae TaxID=2942213 RepID=A0ABT0PDN1_9GAMM|nr:NAD+ synthase [Sansalvadorimonas sp. 2012CJ34-2]MCL6269493.1 NAD+ synthase [Sansalvadorimonas sp. 2012CJ34-2]